MRNVILTLVVLFSHLFSALTAQAQMPYLPDLTELYNVRDPTDRWIINFSVGQGYERRGADFTSARYQSDRLGTTLVDIVYDFDFELIATTEARLRDVNRGRALLHVFNMVTAGATNNIERHLRLLKWLQQATYHDAWLQPMYPDADPEFPRTAVFDPLVLLELGSMRCGHVAALAADLWAAAGYESRRVQLAAHVIAEVYYDGSWHYFDADVFSGGDVIMVNGVIPSIEQLSLDPFLIDRLPGFVELAPDGLPAFWRQHYPGQDVPMEPYPSYYYFGLASFSQNPTGPARTTIWYYVKHPGAPANRLYGWNYYDTVISGAQFRDIPFRYAPHAPELVGISQQSQSSGDCDYLIDWQDVTNPNLVGYRVYTSSVSRGWSYGRSRSTFLGSPAAARYASSATGWEPQMYPKLTRELPGRVATVGSSEMNLSVPRGTTLYLSLVAYDSHGEMVGRRVYSPSSEVRLACP